MTDSNNKPSDNEWVKCEACGTMLKAKKLKRHANICPKRSNFNQSNTQSKIVFGTKGGRGARLPEYKAHPITIEMKKTPGFFINEDGELDFRGTPASSENMKGSPRESKPQRSKRFNIHRNHKQTLPDELNPHPAEATQVCFYCGSKITASDYAFHTDIHRRHCPLCKISVDDLPAHFEKIHYLKIMRTWGSFSKSDLLYQPICQCTICQKMIPASRWKPYRGKFRCKHDHKHS